MVQCLNFVVQNIISHTTGKGLCHKIVAHTIKYSTEREHWMQVKRYRKHFKMVGERETNYSCEISRFQCSVCENYCLLGCHAM
jgi:hypothetical protein